jgi:hypothetical protein
MIFSYSIKRTIYDNLLILFVNVRKLFIFMFVANVRASIRCSSNEWLIYRTDTTNLTLSSMRPWNVFIYYLQNIKRLCSTLPVLCATTTV